MYPGAIEFTVIFALPSSLDNDFVNPLRPALVAPYTDKPLKPVEPIIEEIFIILPLFLINIDLDIYFVNKIGANKFTSK